MQEYDGLDNFRIMTALKIDLHSHTHYSDGQLSPEELVMRAHNMQVDALAITDHDTTAAIEQANAFQAQQTRQMQIIAGVELSTAWHGFDIHVIGLNVDIHNTQFKQRLDEQSQSRERRALSIGEKLTKCGLAGVYEKAKTRAGKGQITRAHFASAMVDMSYVDSFDSAFKKYLGKGKRAHVKPQWITIEQAVKWIRDAGGKAVLAHPGHYQLTAKWLRRLLVQFKEAGGIGIEVRHPRISPQVRQQLAIYAAEYGFEASVGSDFHYPNKWTELGRNLSIPDELTPVWHDWHLDVVEIEK